VARKVIGEGSLLLVAAGNIVERGVQLVRGIVSVEAQRHSAAFVEEQERRGELDLEKGRQRLLREDPAVGPGDLAVGPDIDGDGVEMPARLVRDRLFAEAGAHQLPAIRAAVLPEVDQQALAFPGGFAHVLAEVEEGLPEPRRNIDGMRARVERFGCASRR